MGASLAAGARAYRSLTLPWHHRHAMVEGQEQLRTWWRRIRRRRWLGLGVSFATCALGWSGVGLVIAQQTAAAAGLLHGLVLLAGAVAGGLAAVLVAGRERVFDSVAELQRSFRAPVLGSVADLTPGSWRRAIPFALACVALIALLAGLLMTRTLGVIDLERPAVLSVIYGRRPPRRPASGLEQHRAKRRSRPFRLADLGAWARKPQTAGAVAPTARTGAKIPLVVRSSASLTSADDLTWAGRLPIDWPGLLAAGYPDPRGPNSASGDELHRLAAPLVRQAFAARAGRRDRIVLLTSAGPGEGRTFVTISLALSLARHHPVLLVDADPGAAGTAARFELAAA